MLEVPWVPILSRWFTGSECWVLDGFMSIIRLVWNMWWWRELRANDRFSPGWLWPRQYRHQISPDHYTNDRTASVVASPSHQYCRGRTQPDWAGTISAKTNQFLSQYQGLGYCVAHWHTPHLHRELFLLDVLVSNMYVDILTTFDKMK